MRLTRNYTETYMANLTRRTFMASTIAATAVRVAPISGTKPAARRIVTLVYDKSLRMMRLIDRAVP